MIKRLKVVAVGDYCGKTYLIQTFIKDELPEPQLTSLSCDVADVQVNGTVIELRIWDTCGIERMKPMRLSAYKLADIVLVFFTIYGRQTFENVEKYWVPEVREHGPIDVLILLVGTNYANDAIFQGPIVTSQEAEMMVKNVSAVGYVECWAEKKFNVEEVFVRAAASGLAYNQTQVINKTPAPNKKLY